MSMVDESGARTQEALRETPWLQEHMQVLVPLRGIIKQVYFIDDAANKTHQTVADITMLGGYSDLRKVPFLSMKSRAEHGEEWTPEPGDNVVVQFINGRWSDPVVVGHLPNPDNLIQATVADAPEGKRRYHMRCNETDVVVDKDGNRITVVHGDETLTIEHNDTNPGNWIVDAEANISVSAGGNISAGANGNIVGRAGGNVDIQFGGQGYFVGDGYVKVESRTTLELRGPRGVIIL